MGLGLAAVSFSCATTSTPPKSKNQIVLDDMMIETGNTSISGLTQMSNLEKERQKEAQMPKEAQAGAPKDTSPTSRPVKDTQKQLSDMSYEQCDKFIMEFIEKNSGKTLLNKKVQFGFMVFAADKKDTSFLMLFPTGLINSDAMQLSADEVFTCEKQGSYYQGLRSYQRAPLPSPAEE
jgi:hypothetical protein